MKPYVWNGERCWRVGDIAKYLGVNMGSLSYQAKRNKNLVEHLDFETIKYEDLKRENGYPKELNKSHGLAKICRDNFKDFVIEYFSNRPKTQIEMKEVKYIKKEDRTPIEILLQVDEEGMTTAKKLYEFLGLNPTHYSRWSNANITENEFAEEGIDYIVFSVNGENLLGGRPTTDYKLSATFAKKLCMTSKSERGEQARNYFIKVEENLKKASERYQAYPQTSTELSNVAELLKMMQHSIQAITGVAQATGKLEAKSTEIESKLDNITSTFATEEESPREYWLKTLRKVGQAIKDYQRAFCESYELLEKRAHCKLDTRLRNKQERMLINGATKTQIKNLNKMDVIEDDPRLSEIYTNIIKEMYCKYC